MHKLWGLGVVAVLTIMIAGCRPAAHTAVRIVQPTGATVSAVQRYSTGDFMGRWVSPTPATSLYLNAHHQLVLFRHDQRTLRGHFTIKLVNDQATLTLNDHQPIKLTLDGANNLTMRQTATTIHLTKDPNWSAQQSDVPTKRAVALRSSSLTPEFKPTY